jgi:hypothetical protein
LKFIVKIVLIARRIAELDDKPFYMNITKKKYWVIFDSKRKPKTRILRKNKKMTKHKSLTNQELLKQLEERLSSFTQDEFVILGRLIGEHRQRFMRIIQTGNPRVYN